MRKRTSVILLVILSVWVKLIIGSFNMCTISMMSRHRSDASAPPRCDFESCFLVAEPQSLARPQMRLYPRVSELVTQSRDCVAKFVHESRPLHKVIPLRRRLFPVADDPDFAAPRWLNPDFARLTGNKTIAKTWVGAATFSDLEKVEKCSRTLVAG